MLFPAPSPETCRRNRERWLGGKPSAGGAKFTHGSRDDSSSHSALWAADGTFTRHRGANRCGDKISTTSHRAGNAGDKTLTASCRAIHAGGGTFTPPRIPPNAGDKTPTAPRGPRSAGDKTFIPSRIHRFPPGGGFSAFPHFPLAVPPPD